MKRAAILSVAGLVTAALAMAMPSTAAPAAAGRSAVAQWSLGTLSVSAEVSQGAVVNPLVENGTATTGTARVVTVLDDVACAYEADIAPTDFVMDPALNTAQVTFTADSDCAPGEAKTFLLVWFGVGATTATQSWDPSAPAAGAGLTRGATATLTLDPADATEMFFEGDLGVTNDASLSQSVALSAA